VRPSSVSLVPSLRPFSLSHAILQSAGSGKKFSAEDQEDIERERKLREQFAQKIHQHTGAGSQQSTGASAFSQQQPPPGAGPSSSFVPPNLPFSPPGMNWMLQRLQKLEAMRGAQNQTWAASRGFRPADQQQQQQEQTSGNNSDTIGLVGRVVFFSVSIVMLIALLQLSDPKSLMNVLAGIPWYEGPPDTVACFLLCRALLPISEQNTIRSVFVQEAATNPSLSFATFIWQRFPTRFNGHRVSQQQLISALCAVVASAPDLKAIQAIIATGKGMATPDAADKIYDALMANYPHCFASAASPSVVTQFAPMQMMMPPPPPPSQTMMMPIADSGASLTPQYQFSSSFVMDNAVAGQGTEAMKSDV
jgi:hypothetical protein